MKKHVTQKIGLLTVALLSVFIAAYYLLRPASSDEIALQSLRAFEAGDVHTLLNLTSAEECRKLHLQETNVRSFLIETLWSHGYPHKLVTKRWEQLPVDQVIYAVSTSSTSNSGPNYPFYIMTTLSPDGRWHLALAYTLYETVALHLSSRNPDTMYEKFAVLASRYGIRGRRSNTAGYLFLRNSQN